MSSDRVRYSVVAFFVRGRAHGARRLRVLAVVAIATVAVPGQYFTPYVPAYPPNIFEPPSHAPFTTIAGYTPGRAVFGDFNKDGFMDFVLSLTGWFGSPNAYAVAYGNPANDYTAPMVVPFSAAPPTPPFFNSGFAAHACADFDGDGWLDVSGGAASTGVILWNDGVGGFVPVAMSGVACIPYYDAEGSYGDVDGDGVVDVVATKEGYACGVAVLDRRVFVSKCDAASRSWSLYAYDILPKGFVDRATTLADIDGDGVDEYVVVGYDSATVGQWGGHEVRAYSLLGGTPTLLSTVDVAGVCGAYFPQICNVGLFLTAGDFDSDGFEDVVVDVSAFPAVQVALRGSASKGLSPWAAATGPIPYGYPALWNSPFVKSLVADFDLDGVPDIGRSSDAEFHVFRAPHAGPTLKQLPSSLGGGVPASWHAQWSVLHDVAAVDVDFDGDLDLLDVSMQLSGTPTLWGGLSLYSQSERMVGVVLNRSIHRAGCGTASGLAPTLSFGTAYPGNPAWTMSAAGVLPGTLVVFALSTASWQAPYGGCALWLDLAPTRLLLPTSSGLGYALADPSGSAQMTTALPTATPATPWIDGLLLYGAAIALDPSGPLLIDGWNFVSTATRGLVIW
jgi:hypothetical protein